MNFALPDHVRPFEHIVGHDRRLEQRLDAVGQHHVLVASSPAQKSGTVSGCLRTAPFRRRLRRQRIRRALAQGDIDVVVAGRDGKSSGDPDRLPRRAAELDRKNQVERVADRGPRVRPPPRAESLRIARTYIKAPLG